MLPEVSRKARWVAYAGAGLLVSLQRLLLGYWPCDDSFITFRFARNLVDHGTAVYNLGHPVFGCSTPLYALLLAALGRMGIPVEAAGAWLTFAMDLIVCLLLVRLAHRLYDSPGLGLAAVVLWLTHPIIALNAVSGMETSLFVGLLLGMVLGLSGGRYGLALVLVALLVWTRIDGLVAFPVWLVSWWRAGRPRVSIAGSTTTLALAVLYLWFTWSTYRTVVPQSALAKASLAEGSLAGIPLMAMTYVAAVGGLLSIWYWFLAPHVLLLIGLARSIVRRRSIGPTEASLLLLAGLHAVFFVLPGRMFASLFPWYYVPFLTLILLPSLHQLAELLEAIRGGLARLPERTLVVSAFATAVCGLLAVVYSSTVSGDGTSLLSTYLPDQVVQSPERMSRIRFAIGVNALLACSLMLLVRDWALHVRRPEGARRPYKAYTYAAMLGILALVPITLDQIHISGKYERRERAYQQIGRWAAANLESGEWIGAVEIGAIGFAAGSMNIYDEAGLVTKEALTEKREGYVRRLHPVMIVERSATERELDGRRRNPAGYVRIDGDYNSVLVRRDLMPLWEAAPPRLD